MAQLRQGYPEIQRSGVEVLQITHNTPAEAERYFRYHSVPYPYLCDPDRAVHEAYGLPLRSIGPLDPLKATAAAALDFVRRGERTEPPFPFFARYGLTKDSPQAVLSWIGRGSCGARSRPARTRSCRRTPRSCAGWRRSGRKVVSVQPFHTVASRCDGRRAMVGRSEGGGWPCNEATQASAT